MLDSLTLLYIHISSAFLTFTLFLVRGIMQAVGKNWREIKLLKILPHLSDTLLLLSGLIIVITLDYGLPFWLIIKIVFLVIYIIFAVKAFSRRTVIFNHRAFIIALVAYLLALLVAYFH
ncbi:SirB2 family protein [Conservatibacter flavescens]|uniref:Invasion protein expression up-regulator SirB n=1 Tax=Conservatibacter flavescens TaxID=28161 RepID=A0A2M8S201_9PAST|nr:SirB2 family protein [Conservatibacter flavescens]PJG85155.1 hypothetical protein CVP05_07830 [Conservatibacter flavescens]